MLEISFFSAEIYKICQKKTTDFTGFVFGSILIHGIVEIHVLKCQHLRNLSSTISSDGRS